MSLTTTFVEPVPSHPATIEVGSIGSLKVKVMVSPCVQAAGGRAAGVGGLHVDRRRRDVVGDGDRGEVACEGAVEGAVGEGVGADEAAVGV